MKDDLQRIMRLVQEGKLSPEDAADLIEAFERDRPEANAPPIPPAPDAPPTSPHANAGAGEEAVPPPPPGPDSGWRAKDPFAEVIDAVERAGREVAQSVNWSEVASSVRSGLQKTVEAVKGAAEQVAQGRPMGFWLNTEDRSVSMELVVPDGKTLRLENSSGNIQVLGGQAEGRVTASAQIRGITPEEARERADQFNLMIEESDHVVIVRPPESTNANIDLVVHLTGATPVEVRSLSGDVTVKGTGAAVRIHGTSGDLHVSGAMGTVDLHTASGDLVLVSSTSLNATLESKSGDVAALDCSGTFSVRTASGDVRLERCAGRTISVEAVTGDVHLDLAEPIDGAVNIRTVQGDTRVDVADGSNVRVALATLRGEVTSNVVLHDEARQDQRITGRLGDGFGTLDISAVSGNITLSPRVIQA